MREQGVVTGIVSPGVVKVSFPLGEGCAGCGRCRPDGCGGVSVDADNEVGALTGDEVEVDWPADRVLQASAMVYLVPVAFLLIGYGMGSGTAFLYGLSEESAGIVGSILLCVASFFLVRWYDRRIGRRGALRARVTEILSREAPSLENGHGRTV